MEVEDTRAARVLFTPQETLVAGGGGGSEELVSRLQAERSQLHSNLQRCLYEIHQRDQKVGERNQNR